MRDSQASMNNLFGGSVARLARYRKARPDNWRKARYSRFSEPYPEACPGFNGKAPILSAFDATALPVRGVQYADEIRGAHLRHTGWFADESGDRGTIRGIVASLPHGRFLPGYYWSDNGEYVLFTAHAFDNIEDAARDADSESEKYADECREDDARFQAMCLAELDVETQTEELEKAIALRHREKFGGKPRVRLYLEKLRVARETLADATRAYERGE